MSIKIYGFLVYFCVTYFPTWFFYGLSLKINHLYYQPMHAEIGKKMKIGI